MKLEKKPLRSIRTRIIKIMAMMFVAVAAAVYLILNTIMLNQINVLNKTTGAAVGSIVSNESTVMPRLSVAFLTKAPKLHLPMFTPACRSSTL